MNSARPSRWTLWPGRILLGVLVACLPSCPPVVPAVARVAVTLSRASVAPGETAQAQAVAYDANGSALPGTRLEWNSSTAAATVDGGGLVTARAAGQVEIVATEPKSGRSGSATLVVVQQAGPSDAAVYQPLELRFRADRDHGNPFTDVTLTATFAGPGGRTLAVPAFYDGDRTWVVRLAAGAPGGWTYRTASSEPSLDGLGGALTIGPANGRRGGLTVNPPHGFRREDGSPEFVMGYEADWLPALGLADAADGGRRLETLLDKVAGSGFNLVSLNLYAHDTSWCPGRGSCSAPADDYGPAAALPWEGTNAAPDHGRLNLAYWRNLDRVIARLTERGITANVQLKSWNKAVRWPAERSRADDLYFDYAVARLAAYDVVWDYSKESFAAGSSEYIANRMERVGAQDPYDRLRTANHNDQNFTTSPRAPLLELYSDQSHADWHARVLAQRAALGRPVFVPEYGYEHGPGGPDDKTFGGADGSNQSPSEMARRALEIVTAGGYPGYYYTYTAWDVVRPGDDPPGHRLFKTVGDFFRATRFWELQPRDDLGPGGAARVMARPGREYVVFLPAGGSATLDLSSAAGPLPTRWVNVVTGETRAGTPVGPGSSTLTPPADIGPGILLVRVGGEL